MKEWLERLLDHLEWANARALEVVRETGEQESLLHVALHGTYHRGQIARELRRAGEESVNTDFIQFVRDGSTG